MTSNMMKFTVKIILSLKDQNNTLLFENEIEKKIVVNDSVLLKDICIDIIQNIGLKRLSNTAKVLIKNSECDYLACASFVPNLELSIGSLKLIFGDSLIFKILVPGNIEEFNEIELNKTFCCNLLHLLIRKHSSFKNCITDPSLKNIIDIIENNTIERISYESLLKINETIKNELGYLDNSKMENSNTLTSLNNSILASTERVNISNPSVSYSTTIENNSISKSSNDCHEMLLNILKKTLPQIENSNTIEKNVFTVSKKVTTNNRSRICFDQNNETPILELWFELTRTPSLSQLQNYADHLNILSNRIDNEKITSHNIKIWFKNRRAKENRVNKSFAIKND
ncbi:Homeobox domain and Homeodomain-like-containing protein [Strongyloides ratti]|uniref:Homeobox domain and Homeodomain-like-containing protein n=1 Tax=Strongyloides ratti TaxID=34506 RepID=A0A090L2W5_STRRB|nr:Homeobox domain and Homeodomain-like-containing protein [Strongyloides ratti]CEF61804.1 Homeobox domain and Homeodomain-like-containing protein [Strongyloides ratti]